MLNSRILSILQASHLSISKSILLRCLRESLKIYTGISFTRFALAKNYTPYSVPLLSRVVPPLFLIFSALSVSLYLKWFSGLAEDRLLLLFTRVRDHQHNQWLYRLENFRSELNKITNLAEVNNTCRRARLR